MQIALQEISEGEDGMGADNMRKLMEAAESLTEKVRRVPASKVQWGDEDEYASEPVVKGINAPWYPGDWQDFSTETLDTVARAVAPHGLKVYVIDDTGGDYIWFAIAP